MKAFLALGLAAFGGFLLAACAPDGVDRRESVVVCPRYEMRIDSRLSPKWQAAILKAIERWSRVLGENFLYHITISDEPADDMPCVIWFTTGVAEPGAYGSLRGYTFRDTRKIQSATIRFLEGEERADIQYSTALHELGHMFGLDHNEDRKDFSIMWPMVTVPGMLGCSDIEGVSKVWGTTYSCKPRSWVDPWFEPKE